MAIQVVYIALVTPGGTVSADVRAACYIGIPLALIAVKGNPGLAAGPAGAEAAALATTRSAPRAAPSAPSCSTAPRPINLAWQAMGWKWLEKGDTHKLYLVDMVLPWISHILCSFLPTFVHRLLWRRRGDQRCSASLPMDGIPMKTLFAVGSLLPCVGIAILLKQVITKATDFLPFFFGFTLAAVMGCNLIACLRDRLLLRAHQVRALHAARARSSSVGAAGAPSPPPPLTTRMRRTSNG